MQPQFFQPTKIMLGYSEIHHRGVLATQNIADGELIERCPLIKLQLTTHNQKDLKLFDYVYAKDCNCIDCTNNGYVIYMVLGYGMMYNHQDKPNTVWIFDYDNEIADVVAKRQINKGEEIFVTYGSKFFSHRLKKISKKKITLKFFKG